MRPRKDNIVRENSLLNLSLEAVAEQFYISLNYSSTLNIKNNISTNVADDYFRRNYAIWLKKNVY